VNASAVRTWVAKTLLGRLLERVGELNPVERGLALGSKLFTTVVPLSILTSAALSNTNGVANRLIVGFGLTGAGADGVRTLFEVPSGQVTSGISVIGVLVLCYSFLSFARALQRVYENAWHLPALRSRGVAWGALWMLAFAVYFSLSTPLANLLYNHGLRVGGTIVTLLFGSLLWLVTPFILLGRRVPLRVLVPGGVASAILLSLFNLGSHAYLPHSLSQDVHRYGLVGVTFSILTWLFAFCLTLIVAAACGAVLGERRADWTDPSLAVADANAPVPGAPPPSQAVADG
jgi:membrane protein